MKVLKISLIVIAVVFVAGLGFIYAGLFNVAADDPHWSLTSRLIETMRERSIAARARDIEPVALDDPALIEMGAEHYAEMCAGCHLAPGMEDSEMRAGLYPEPPNLVEHGAHRSPEQTFWIIKHGLKMTGMPAWGVTHDDRSIWGMVAFLQKLPQLSLSQYEELVAQGRASGHAHDEEESGHTHGDASMPQQPEEAKGHSHGEDGHGHQHGEANTKDKNQEHSHDHEKPTANISGLLRERPDAKGLAVPGMPIGSPGMEVPSGETEPYEVFLVAQDGSTTVFSRHGQ